MWRSVETDHVRGGARGRSAVGGGLTVSIRFRYARGRRAHDAPPAPVELDGRVGANPCHDYNSNHDMDWSEHGASRGMSGWWDPKIPFQRHGERRTDATLTRAGTFHATGAARARTRRGWDYTLYLSCVRPGSPLPGRGTRERAAAGSGAGPGRPAAAGGRGRRVDCDNAAPAALVLNDTPVRVAAGHGARDMQLCTNMHHAGCLTSYTNTGGCGVPLNSHTPFHKPPAPRTNRHARTTMSSRRHVRSISSPLLYKPSGRLSKRAS